MLAWHLLQINLALFEKCTDVVNAGMGDPVADNLIAVVNDIDNFGKTELPKFVSAAWQFVVYEI